MRHPSFALTVTTLALLTGLCLGQLVTLGRSPGGSRAISIADARVGNDFYRAINRYLLDSDSTDLQQVVDPAVLTNLPGLASRSGLDGLTGYLDRVRAVDPTFQLVPGTMQSLMNGVSAEVTAQRATEVSILGLPIDASSLWGDSDFLELRNGRVAAVWSSLPAVMNPLLEARRTIAMPAPVRIEPTLERWSLTPHIEYHPQTGKTATVLRLLSGSARIAIDRPGAWIENVCWTGDASDPAPETLRPGTPVELEAGDVVSVAPQARFTILAHGSEPAELVVLTQEQLASTITIASESTDRESDGLPRLILARGQPIALATDSMSVDTLVLELTAGMDPLAHRTSAEEIVYVASGKLRLTIDSGKGWQANPDRSPSAMTQSAVVEAGSGFILERGSQVSYEPVDGDALLWFASVAPA